MSRVHERRESLPRLEDSVSEKVENPPSFEDWRSLYDAAVRIKELAPWDWMTESDVFGVQSPETDELGFVSVMGMAGEHFGIAVYRGTEGLYGFWALSSAGPYGNPEQLLEIPQLQASFENRDVLHQDDRDRIKELGLKFRGRHEWPLFRSYRPGYYPWFLEAEEARFLRHALEQTINVTTRFNEDPSLLEPTDDESYLIRVPRTVEGKLVWHDEIREVPPPEPSELVLMMDLETLEELKRDGRRIGQTVEMDFFMIPATVQETPRSRPFYPYLLLVMLRDQDLILGSEMFEPAPSLEAMWSRIPQTVVALFHGAEIIPEDVHVRSDLLYQLLQPVARELKFKVKQVRRLRALDEAKSFLIERFM